MILSVFKRDFDFVHRRIVDISPDDWKESYLNEYEKANANLILEYENR